VECESPPMVWTTSNIMWDKKMTNSKKPIPGWSTADNFTLIGLILQNSQNGLMTSGIFRMMKGH
jgi:hypothetical protein